MVNGKKLPAFAIAQKICESFEVFDGWVTDGGDAVMPAEPHRPRRRPRPGNQNRQIEDGNEDEEENRWREGLN